MDDKAYVGFVDAHSECNGCDNNVDLFHQKFILVSTSGICIHSGMIGGCFDSVDLQYFCQFFYFFTAEAVDDAGFAFVVLDEFDDVFCRVIFWAYLIIKVRSVE